MNKKLDWEEKYSVGVKIIDDQHKKMFDTINHLIDVLAGVPTKESVDGIVNELVLYKQYHFQTEEKYFDEFGYDGAEEHKAKHREFNTRLSSLVTESNGDSISMAFALVDFLEDWLLNHLMVIDQKYVPCFREHGLK